MNAAALVERLRREGLLREVRGEVRGVEVRRPTRDSREVREGSLFAAIPGTRSDGHDFLADVLEAGAAVVLVERAEALPDEHDALALVVRDARAAWAELACGYFGDPSEELVLVGVTGTNGKSTTAFLLYELLGRLGHTAGLIGTVAWRVGEHELEATHTTPDAFALQRLLRQMVETGCTACAMEVSSHALDQERVRGAAFDVGVFTNLTQDHLDYHQTPEAYLAAKKRLFDGLHEAAAVTNADDAAGATMVEDTAARVLRYGTGADADVRFQLEEDAATGLRLILDGHDARFRLVGRFNAYNLAAAYTTARALGYDADEVLEALQEASPVPGRFEQVALEDGPLVVIDYAHTPDALENVLQTARGLVADGAQLWCVFGCGGDRDPSKRRVMGALAEQLADVPVVTSDNPRTEDPDAILNDIRRGMSRPAEALWIADRAAAIERAVTEAGPQDVVLVAGKGHETYQIVGTERRAFSDREEVLRSARLRTASPSSA